MCRDWAGVAKRPLKRELSLPESLLVVRFASKESLNSVRTMASLRSSSVWWSLDGAKTPWKDALAWTYELGTSPKQRWMVSSMPRMASFSALGSLKALAPLSFKSSRCLTYVWRNGHSSAHASLL